MLLARLLTVLALCGVLNTHAQSKRPPRMRKMSVSPYWHKDYFRQLRQVSLRYATGIGYYHSFMTYQLPDVGAMLSEAVEPLKSEYRWVPWDRIEIKTLPQERTKQVSREGVLFETTGINLPLIFAELEIGPGRFSEPWMNWEEAKEMAEARDWTSVQRTMLNRLSTPQGKPSLTLRVGVELERLLPDHWQPKLRWRNLALGLDAAAYLLVSGDMSYHTGIELIAPDAQQHLQTILDPIPLVPQNWKNEATEVILARVSDRLPTYFWAPMMKGRGLVGKVYLDMGKIRLAARYHYERSIGIATELEGLGTLPAGPVVLRSFLTFGIETPL